MGKFVFSLSLLSLLAGCDDGGGTKDVTVGDSNTTTTRAGDEDHDGFTPDEGDCDDSKADVNPSSTEACDGIDNNCNNEIDEGVTNTYYKDSDGDGFGSASQDDSKEACEAPDGFVNNNQDCDDTQAKSFPGNPESCDGIDNDCDGVIDNGVTGTYYQDADGDGFGDPNSTQTACERPNGYVEDATDCDDTTARANPDGVETCDQIDNNCDGQVDEGVSKTYYADFDNDKYGSNMLSQQACAAPTGYVTDNTDCDDMVKEVNPAAKEVCDGIDNNCDGTVDENTAADALTWYADTDADNYGDAASTTVACEAPIGYVADKTDCDDTKINVNPGLNELCDGFDNNCDGKIDEDTATDAKTWYIDSDRDNFGSTASTKVACNQPSGYVADSTDCNDGSNIAYPGATEKCDGIDNNCDGIVDESTAVDASTWYADTDNDNFGDPASSKNACSQPSGYVSKATDCDDNRAQSYPGATEYCNGFDDDCDGTVDEDAAVDASTWYADTDGDGYGNKLSTTKACSKPAGYSADNTDCDDTRALTNPGALEYCNSYDDDCDGTVDESAAVDASTWYLDADRDAYGNPAMSSVACSQPNGYVSDYTDCNDGSAKAYPGNTEVCDGIDNNCDGITDENTAADAKTWYADSDGDNYGDPNASTLACSQPSGYVSNNTDCLDTRAASNPGATEYCNGYDDDCDGTVDENAAVDAKTWYQDSDADTYGNRNVTTVACSAPAGYVADATDCDDTRALSNPGATEYCNGYDDNCTGGVDESTAADALTWYLDADGDKYGKATASTKACSQPSGYVADNTDCNDGASSAYPGATEVCDGIDNNCDGAIDEGASTNAGTWYQDYDGDGYGNPSVSQKSCSQPSGYVANNTDCLDTRNASYPGAAEYCNGYDDDCDGTVDEDQALDVKTWYQDADADTYGNASVKDIDCNQPVGYVADKTDCDDTRAASNPGALEYCNGYDDNCNGTIDESTAVDAKTWYRDADNDSYGLLTSSQKSCSQPSGYVANSTDCNDLDATAYPGASEYCDGVDDDCNGTVDDNPVDGTTYYYDGDKDGFGATSPTKVACSLPSGYAANSYDCIDTDKTEPVVADAVNGTSSGAGTLTAPFASLQSAIDQANQCVVAYSGTYNEQITISKSIDIWGVEGAAYTIIDANMPLCTTANPTACGAAVTIASGSSTVPELHGFTITGGSGRESSSSTSTTCADSTASHQGANTCTVTIYEYEGGGLYIDGDDPILYDLNVKGNTLPDFAQVKGAAKTGKGGTGGWTQTWMYSYGGAVFLKNSNATFTNVNIYDNYADEGGGIFVTTGSAVTYEQGKVTWNSASDGGGLALDGGTISMTNAAVYCNTATTDGGGIFTEVSGSVVLTNAALYKNTASTATVNHGLSAYIGASTYLYMYNTVVQDAANAYALYGSGTASFSYNNVYNTPGSGYGGSMAAGASSISSATNFTSVTCDNSYTNDNFTLVSSSPDINAGNPASAYNDYDGSRNDIGPKGGPKGNW